MCTLRRLFLLFTAFTLALLGGVVAFPTVAHATTPSCTSTPTTWADLQTAMMNTGTSASPNVVCLGANLIGVTNENLRIAHLQYVVLDLNGHSLAVTGGTAGAGIDTNVDGHLTIQDSNPVPNVGLTATGGPGSAGIGGASSSGGSYITITSGTVNAFGGSNGSGIGGGDGGAGGDITISGGHVQCFGGENAAGIGGGRNGAGGNITVTAGLVFSDGGFSGAALGGGINGDGPTATLSGGMFQLVSGSAPIGSGAGGAAGGTLTVRTLNSSTLTPMWIWSGQRAQVSTSSASATAVSVTTTAFGYYYLLDFKYAVTFDTGGGSGITTQEVSYGQRPTLPAPPTRAGYAMDTWHTGNASGPIYSFSSGAAITSATTLYASWGMIDTTCSSANKPTTWDALSGSISSATSSNSSSSSPKVVCLGADLATTGTHLALNSGAYVTLDLNGYQLEITAESGHAAIQTAGAFFTVQDSRPGTNALVVAGGGYSAAIGGWTSGAAGTGLAGGSITINSGKIRATGGYSAAGIGGSWQGAGGSITINGGTVISFGGDYAAGIGGGYFRDSGTITITGGTITATGGFYAAGIGGGNFGSGGTTVINGGTISAIGGDEGAGIGGGHRGSGGITTINGGVITSTGGVSAAGIGGGWSANGGQIRINSGTVTATGGLRGAGLGGGQWDDGAGVLLTGGKITATSDSAVIGSGAGAADGGGLNIQTLTSSVLAVAPSGLGADGGLSTAGFTRHSTATPGAAAVAVETSSVGSTYVLTFTYAVAFNSGNGSNVSQQAVGYGSRPIQPTDPAWAGHTFDQWHTTSASGPNYDFNAGTPITAATTLYASWNAITASPLSINPGTRAVSITQTDRQVGSSWDVSVHSTPVSIGSGVTNGSAALTFNGTIPSVAAGVHHVEVSSTSSNGVAGVQKLWFVCDLSGSIIGVYATESEASAAWAALQPLPTLQPSAASLGKTGLNLLGTIHSLIAGSVLLLLGIFLVAGRHRRSY